MAVFLSPVGGVAAQFFTNTGAVLTGGKIYTYAAGTTTPAATFTNSGGSTYNTNPIVLDAAGRVSGSGEIWLGDGVQYKFVLKDANDVLIATYDNISGINSDFTNFLSNQEIFTATAGQTVFTLANPYVPGANTLSVFVDGVNQYGPGASYAYLETNSTTVTFVSGLHVGASVKFTTVQSLTSTQATTAALVSYNEGDTGAVTYTVQARLRQIVSVKDFGATGDGTTNDAIAVQAALNTGKSIHFPKGTYYVGSTTLTLPENVVVFGDGASTTILGTGADPVMVLTGTSSVYKSNLILRDLTIKRTNGTYANSRQLVEFTYANDCFIQNVIFDGDIATSAYPGSFIGYSVNRLTIDSCNFVNGASCQLTSYGVLSANPWSDECVIRNCYRAPSATQGFDFYYVKNLIVDGCTASGSTSTYGCGFIVEYEAQNVTFTNCISFGHTRSGYYYEPNVAYGISNVSLSNCTAYSNGETGLYAQNIYRINVTGGAYHSTLSTFGGDYGGIAIHNGQDLAITGAQIFSNQGFGIFLDGGQDYAVVGNFFNNNNGPAIKIGSSPATIGVQLVGNTFLSNISTVSGWVESTSGQWITGPWASYTPTVYSNDGTTTVTISNSSFKYKLIGSVCHVEGYFEVTGSAANSTMYFTTPFTGDWTGGTSANALTMRGTAAGNSSGVKPIDGRYYNGRLSIVGMGASDTQIKFTAAYDVAV